MRSKNFVWAVSCAAAVLLPGCRGSKLGNRSTGEITVINVRPSKPIDPKKLSDQVDYHDGLASRGAFPFSPTAVGSSAIGVVVTSVKKAIDNERKKYQATYSFNLSADGGRRIKDDSMYFYSAMSNKGPFDVEDMQFAGFTIARLYKDDDSAHVAMKATFELDTTNLYEIVYDGVFRLKMKDIEFNYAKAKLPRGKKKINLDIEVEILASYITREGQLNNNVVLGKFETTLKGLSLQNAEGCKQFANKRMNGWSFIVPRSYCRGAHGTDQWNQGNYKVNVTVKETSKQRSVNKVLLNKTQRLMDEAKNDLDMKGLIERTIKTNNKK